MLRTTILGQSTEFIRVDVTGPVSDQDVFMALKPAQDGAPEAEDWFDAEWEEGGSTARLIVGPGTTRPLSPGRYAVYVRIVDNPEIPVLPAGVITVL